MYAVQAGICGLCCLLGLKGCCCFVVALLLLYCCSVTLFVGLFSEGAWGELLVPIVPVVSQVAGKGGGGVGQHM
jgi:hypothetical protein